MRIKRFRILIIGICIFIMTGCPVLGYEVDELDISVHDDGSATLTGKYSLNWGEFLAYSLIVDREAIAENAIEVVLHKDVKLNYITNKEASVTIPQFVKIMNINGTDIYSSPAIPFSRIKDASGELLMNYPMLNNYILNEESMIPDKTIITFPDGYSVVYSKPYPGSSVPSVTH